MKRFNGIKYSILALVLSATVQGSDVNGNIIKGSQAEANRRNEKEEERARQKALEEAKADTRKRSAQKEMNERQATLEQIKSSN